MPTSDSRAMSRHPFQVWAMFAFIIGGVGTLLGPSAGSVETLVPVWVRVCWAVVLLASGLAGLAAALWRDRLTALLLERAALLLIVGGAAPYALAVFKVAGMSGFVAGVLVLSVALAALRRVIQVTRSLRLMRAFLRGNP